MNKVFSWIVVCLGVLLVDACVPKEEGVSASDFVETASIDTPSFEASSPVGCWLCPQDSSAGKMCIYEDSILFYDLLMVYPYYTEGDSLIVTSIDGDVFIRWRYVRQHDTLLLFQHSAYDAEEYVVLMTLAQ